MPAAINADDATKPLDNDVVNYPASQGAGELRALKAKINQLFLNTGVGIQQYLLQTNSTGIYVNYSATPALLTQILYGFACNVTRTGLDNHVVGGQFGAYIADNVTLNAGEAFGAVANAFSGSLNSNGTLVAFEAGVNSYWNNNPGRKTGMNPVFKNRPDGAAAAASGLGANKYNFLAWAIYINSIQRGTDGAYCGWAKGIYFDQWSMDLYLNGATPTRGYAIDTYDLQYDGGTDPRTAFRVDAVLRMRTLQRILWDDGFANKFAIWMDPVSGRMSFSVEAYAGGMTTPFAIDMNTGAGYKNGVAVF